MSNPKMAGKAWQEIHEFIVDYCRMNEIQETDQDDLDHRVLVTFPVWLRGRICDELLRGLVGCGDHELRAIVIPALRGERDVTEEESYRLWEVLQEAAPIFSDRLVPLRRTRQASDKTVFRLPYLQYVDPANPLDLVARMTRIKRMMMKTGDMGEIPAEYRQNHPSFRGRICPVESPESESVGLHLQLARGAHVDFDGRIHTAPQDNPAEELGFGASLIPFYEHNDGSRNMMGAKNLRQAIPVAGRSAPTVKTEGEEAVDKFVGPLVHSGICPSWRGESGAPALGIDLLVAYMPWMGMNFEDAIVVSQQVVDSGILDVVLSSRHSKRLRPGWVPRGPDRLSVFESEEGGLAKAGETLFSGEIIASFAWEGRAGAERHEIRYTERSPALLKSIRFSRGADWMGASLSTTLRGR